MGEYVSFMGGAIMTQKKFYRFRNLVVAVTVCLLFTACGTSDDPPASSSMVVTPSLGSIIGADVKATKPDGTQLGSTVKTNATGTATVTFSGYSGPVIVEVAGNATATYFDEALGINTAFAAGEKLRAALDGLKTQVGVTPLTEIALQYAETVAGSTTSLTATSIKTANETIRQTLASEIADITAPPTLVSTSTTSGTLDTSDASKYAAKLAALAKLAQAKGGVAITNPALSIAKQLAADLKDGVLDGKSGSTTITGTTTYTVASLAEDLKTQMMNYTAAFGNAALQTLASGGTLSTIGSGSTGGASLCEAGYVGATATTGISIPGTCGTVTYCVSQTNPTVSAYYLIGSTKIAVDLTKLISGTTVNLTYAQQLGLDIATACTGSGSAGGSTTDATAPTVTAFAIPTSSTSLTVAIKTFTATDTVGVTGYRVTESATPPAASAEGWSTYAPTDYMFPSEGSKTLYAWAKDAAGNVSASRSAAVAITIGGGSTGSSTGSGSLDTSFDIDGKVTTDFAAQSLELARGVAIQTDGKIVAAGGSNTRTGNRGFALARYNTDGSLDTTFDTDGKVTTAMGTSWDDANAVAIQADGKIVVAGDSRAANLYNHFALARYNADGSLDTTFGTGGKVITDFGTSDDHARAVKIQSDGKIVVAGSSNNNGFNTDFALARYNADGSLDTTFGTGGKVTTAMGTANDVAYAVTIQADGKIIAAGYASTGGIAAFALARYTATGSLDATFGTGGKITTAVGTDGATAHAVAIQSDGKIVAAGDTSIGGAPSDFALVRYTTTGSLDTTFGTGGKVTTAVGTDTDIASAVAIQSDGKIVAAGYSINSSVANFGLARYNTDGSLDTTFDTDGKVTTVVQASWNEVYALAIQSDGKIVAAGYSSNGIDSNFALVRYWQ